MESFCWK